MKSKSNNKIVTTHLRLYLIVLSIIYSTVAYADLFDNLKNAVEIIKQTGVLDKIGTNPQDKNSTGNENNNSTSTENKKTTNSDETSIASPTADTNSNTNNTVRSSDLPLGLNEYPQSELLNRVDNPYEELIIPISPPRRINSDKWIPRYTVPVEGKVTMLLYKHEANDSPLLIQKHYESWLASNGFDRLLVCKAPCKDADTVYWLPYIDQASRFDFSYLPRNATYIAAYKENAMALVSVGQSGSKTHASFVKLVEGKVLDNTNWVMLKTSPQPLPEVAPSAPAARTVANTPTKIFTNLENRYVNKPLPKRLELTENKITQIPTTKNAPIGIQEIPFDTNLVETFRLDKPIPTLGLVAMLFTKTGDCKECKREEIAFEKSAKKYAGNLNFLRAVAPDHPRVVFGDAVQYIAFPSMILYQDGKRFASSFTIKDSGDLDVVIKKHHENNDENNAKKIRWNNAITMREKRGIPGRGLPLKPVPLNLPTKGTATTEMLHASLNANRPEEVLNWAEGSEGILVMHATGDISCTYCKKSNPVFTDLAKKYSGRATFMMVQSAFGWQESFASDFARAYELSALPTTYVFKDGVLIRRLNGYYPLEKMDAELMQ